MSFVHHHLDVYDCEVFLARTKREWSALKRHTKATLDPAPQSAGLTTFATYQPVGSFTRPHLFLWVDAGQHQRAADLVNTCAHEAAHAASYLLNHLDHTIRVSDEPHAYLVGWLTEWLWSHCSAALDQ